MGKYYAQLRPLDYFDFEHWFSEEDAKEEKIWIGGNREYQALNKEFVDDLRRKLDECNYDINTIIESDDMSEEDMLGELLETIKYYFGFRSWDTTKINFKDRDYKKILKICLAYSEYSQYSYEDLDAVCDLLEVLYRQKFEHGTIKGNSQGDWQFIVYPSSLSKEYIEFIEAVYWGTGSVWNLSDSELNSMDEFDIDYSTEIFVIENDINSTKQAIIKQFNLPIKIDDLILVDENGKEY